MAYDIRAASAAARSVAEKWLIAHVDACDPHRWDSVHEALFRRKCFAELALYIQLIDGFPERGEFEPWLTTQLRNSIVSRVDGRFVSLAKRNPNNILMFASPLSLAIKYGSLPLPILSAAKELLISHMVWGVERTPFRTLDLAASCRFAGLEPPIKISNLIQVSALQIPPCATTASNDAFYALTHCAFYGFSASGGTMPDRKSIPALHVSLEGAACRCLIADDLDLGLELAAASALIGLPLGVGQQMIVLRAINRLLDTGKTGCLPSAAASAFMQVCPAEDWSHEFHTMLVAALTLSILEHFDYIGQLEPKDGDQLFVSAIGQAYRAARTYDLRTMADLGMMIIENFDLTPSDFRLLEPIISFIQNARNVDGQYGDFVDEDHIAQAASGGENRLVLAESEKKEITLVCQSFLDKATRIQVELPPC